MESSSNSLTSYPFQNSKVFGRREVDLCCLGEDYFERILKVQEHVFQLSRHYRTCDEHFKLYKNETKNGFGDIVEKITPDITMEEYLKISKEKFLVYEIFDYMNSRERVELVNILIYYPESKLCFFYKAKNHYHVMLFGFYFEKILRNIDKEKLDELVLHKVRTLEHDKLLQTQPYRVSNIMNPDGYVHFPEYMEDVFENYVNTTNKPYPHLNLKFFRNYLWIHYHTMKPIEEKYLLELAEIARDILMKEKKELPKEIVEYIMFFY